MGALLNLIENAVNVFFSIIVLIINLIRGIFSLITFAPDALGLLSSFVAFSPPLFLIFLSASLAILIVRFIIDR